jgi:hypothetical protein
MSVGEGRNDCVVKAENEVGGTSVKLIVCLGGLSKRTNSESSTTCSNVIILVVAP